MSKFLLCGALVITLANLAAAAEVDQDLKALQGTWKLVSLQTPKMKLADARALNQQIQIAGSDWTQYEFGAAGLSSQIELGVVDKTKAINLSSVYVSEEIVEHEVIRGIYKVEGDTLTVATARVNNPQRPQKFTFAGSVNMLAVYKRVK